MMLSRHAIVFDGDFGDLVLFFSIIHRIVIPQKKKTLKSSPRTRERISIPEAK